MSRLLIDSSTDSQTFVDDITSFNFKRSITSQGWCWPLSHRSVSRIGRSYRRFSPFSPLPFYHPGYKVGWFLIPLLRAQTEFTVARSKWLRQKSRTPKNHCICQQPHLNWPPISYLQSAFKEHRCHSRCQWNRSITDYSEGTPINDFRVSVVSIKSMRLLESITSTFYW